MAITGAPESKIVSEAAYAFERGSLGFLRNILEINVEELSPEWLKNYSNETNQISIHNIEKDDPSKIQTISFSRHLLYNLDLSKLKYLLFFQLDKTK